MDKKELPMATECSCPEHKVAAKKFSAKVNEKPVLQLYRLAYKIEDGKGAWYNLTRHPDIKSDIIHEIETTSWHLASRVASGKLTYSKIAERLNEVRPKKISRDYLLGPSAVANASTRKRAARMRDQGFGPQRQYE